MAVSKFGWSEFGVRLLVAIVLVAVTWNPEGWSFSHWIYGGGESPLALKAFVGILLLIGWTIYLRATYRSLGLFGLLLVSALFGTAVMVLVQYGWISADTPRMFGYIVMCSLALMLAIGISWSHVRRRLSGQVDTDDVDE